MSTRHPGTQFDGGCRILVVDDERSIAQLAALMLRRQGWKVEIACHPADALEMFGDGSGFDLVVSDFVMPEMNGCEMVAAMRRRKPDLAAVFISGYAEEIAKCHCPLLSKPFRADDLVEHVRKGLAAIVPTCTGDRIPGNRLALAMA
ncbi:MAG TPA: response regulator [Bryobacteraceae bacterium]|nr:response regulator [Bryobacteraceae bacterium]